VKTGDNMRPRGPDLPKQPQRTDDPEYWRFRAKNTRVLASETKDVSAKKILEDVAASYERLAELAEQGRKEKSAEES
jgi:hypothetical protein